MSVRPQRTREFYVVARNWFAGQVKELPQLGDTKAFLRRVQFRSI